MKQIISKYIEDIAGKEDSVKKISYLENENMKLKSKKNLIHVFFNKVN